VSVRRSIIEALVQIIYTRERCYIEFSIVCIQKGIKKPEVKVDVQKRVLRFREKIDMLVSSITCLHPLLSYGNCPRLLPCPFLLGFAFWVLGVYILEALGVFP
jgi:hypothetical protein